MSQEEQTVYEKEPEMFGDYALSLAGDGSSDIERDGEKTSTTRGKGKKVPTRSNKASKTPDEAVDDKTTSETHHSDANGHQTHLSNPHLASDLATADPVAIPAPKKLPTGRYECPFTCGKTFSEAKGAKRHAAMHVDADKFKCTICGKGYSRNDLYQSHIKSHAGEKTMSSKQQARSGHNLQSIASGASHGKDSLRRPLDALSNAQVKAANDPRRNKPEPEIMAEASAAVLDPVTSAESETESEDESAPAEGTTNTTKSTVETKDDIPMEDASGDETTSSSESDSEVSPVKSRASPVPEPVSYTNDLKRKRPSLSPRPSSIVPSRKRARREASTGSIEVEESEREESAASGAKSSRASVPNEDPRSDRSASDVEMPDGRDENEGIAHDESELEPEAEPVKPSMRPKPKGKAPDAASRTKNTKQITDALSPNATGPTSSTNRRKGKASSPPPAVGRQSSMDNFVSRSRSASNPPVRASSSGSKVTVNVPQRQKTKRQLQAQQVVEDSEEQRTARRKAKKGQGKAQEDKDREVVEESETHSSDRPKATTTARRTLSLTSKPKLKRKSRVAARLQDEASSEDQSDVQENVASDTDTDTSRAKRQRPRRGGPQTSTSGSGRTGKFSQGEVQALLSWRDSFCSEHDLTPTEFNNIMTASMRRTGGYQWPYKFITRVGFLSEYHEQLPNRNKRSMNRFRERHFQNVESTTWTKQDDDELRGLVNQLGPKWVEIAQMMGRTADAVTQRWKHKLNYGEEVKEGEWSAEEVKCLEEEVEAYAKSKGTTARNDSLNVPWHAISLKIGNGRSGQQCSNRWRVNTTRRVKGKFMKVPLEDRIPGSATKLPKPESKTIKAPKKDKTPKTPSKLSQRLAGDDGTPRTEASQKRSSAKKSFKSAERVTNSDDESDENSEEEEQTDNDSDGEDQATDAEADLDKESAAESSQNTASDGGQAEPDSNKLKQHNANPRDAGTAEVEEDIDEDNETRDEQDADEDQEQVSGQDQAPGTDSGTDSGSDNISDTIEVRSPTPPPQPSQKRTQASQSQSQQHGKKKQSSPQKSSQSQPQPQTQTQKSSRTPAISKNPLRATATKTPANDLNFGLTLSQLHAGTQANSSAKRTTTGKSTSARSRVPDSAIEERPSPELSVRRRPVSSPLGRMLVDDEDEDGDGEQEDEDEDTIEVRSPQDESFVSARSDARLRSPGPSESESESGSSADSDTDGREGKHNKHAPNASHGSFWQSVNGIAKRFVPGLSQHQGSQAPSQSQSQNKRRSLADALTQGGVGDDESDSDDE